jgi:hypothetical protein
MTHAGSSGSRRSSSRINDGSVDERDRFAPVVERRAHVWDRRPDVRRRLRVEAADRALEVRPRSHGRHAFGAAGNPLPERVEARPDLAEHRPALRVAALLEDRDAADALAVVTLRETLGVLRDALQPLARASESDGVRGIRPANRTLYGIVASA